MLFLFCKNNIKGVKKMGDYGFEKLFKLFFIMILLSILGVWKFVEIIIFNNMLLDWLLLLIVGIITFIVCIFTDLRI